MKRVSVTIVCIVGMSRDYVLFYGVIQSLSSLAVCALFIFGILHGWAPSASAVTNLVWSDEFNGTSLDTTKWNFDLGNDSTISEGGGGEKEGGKESDNDTTHTHHHF